MSIATNREVYRDLIAGYVQAALVAGGTLDAVYGNAEVFAWLDKKKAVMLIVSDGTERIKDGAGSAGYATKFYFVSDRFVLLSDADWTPAQCEDRLDLIDQEFFELLQANSNSKVKWRLEGRSRTGSYKPGGKTYRHEPAAFSVTIYKA